VLAALLLAGLLALALRILLLLSGFLATTLLLTRVLALLARILVLLLRHWGTPWLDVRTELTAGIHYGC
jgi:hypothetical protein